MYNSNYLRDIEDKYGEFTEVTIDRVEPTKLSEVLHDIQQDIRDLRVYNQKGEEAIQHKLNNLQRRLVELERGYRPM